MTDRYLHEPGLIGTILAGEAQLQDRRSLVASLSGYFAELQRRIEPGADRLGLAKDIPAEVRDYLKQHAEFLTVAPHTRLAGSYGRDTAIKEIKDVDILAFVPQSSREGNIADLLQTLKDALVELPDSLDDCGSVSLREQRRSVNVTLDERGLSVDIVPVYCDGDDVDGVLEVPDRDWSRWVPTQPLGYADLLSTLNGEHENKIVPLIKLVKHWRDVHFVHRRPKSYWLESLVVQHIRRGWVKTSGKGKAQLIAGIFESIDETFKETFESTGTPRIPDAMLSNNVAWNWERASFETFMRRLRESRSWARQALDTTDTENAVELWQKVFGVEWFPTTEAIEAEAREMGRLSAIGGLYVTSTGAVSTQKPTTGISVQSPAKRFYGDKT